MQELSPIIELYEDTATDLRRLTPRVETPINEPDPEPPMGSWQDSLGRIVQSEIIPRLLLSNMVQPVIASRARAHLDPGDFIKVLLKADASAALAYVRQFQAQGMPVESILLDVLGEASRYLGALWESDHCDFIEVSDGLRHLQILLQALSPLADLRPDAGRRAMFLTAPNETHDFGVRVVEHFFHMAGWDTKHCFEQDHIAALREGHYDVVGFSLSCHRYLDGLNAAVKTARQMSKNPDIKVLVGGAIFQRDPSLVNDVDADGMAVDAPGAVLMAEHLLKECACV